MQHVGIDIAKRKVDLLWLRDVQTLKRKRKTFENTIGGAVQLKLWLGQQIGAAPEQVQIVMEATSVYHELLAQELHAAGYRVCVVNPLQAKRFAQSHGLQTKNDRHDPLLLARMSAERQAQLRAWEPEPPQIKHLKALLTRLVAVEKDLRRELNRWEKAHVTGAPAAVMQSLTGMIETLREQAQQLRREIDKHIDQNPDLKRDRELLQSIPGIGEGLSSILLSVIHSRRFTRASQLGAYLGLAPIEDQSGDTVKGKTRLGKTGPAWIRAKLYYPAIVAKRYNPDVAALYARLLRRGLCKKAAIAAAMRKLLHIAFGVIKHQTPYQPHTA
jgi:transposase